MSGVRTGPSFTFVELNHSSSMEYAHDIRGDCKMAIKLPGIRMELHLVETEPPGPDLNTNSVAHVSALPI